MNANQNKAQYGMAGLGAASHLGGLSAPTKLAVDLPSAAEASPDALRNTLKASIDKCVPAAWAAGVEPE